ncbi:MAG: DUF58 domain-containing protein [Ignisphaera sp.]
MCDKSIARELEDVTMSIVIKNSSGEPISRVLVIDKTPRYAKSTSDPIAMISIPPNSAVTISYKVKLLAPGTHTFSDVVIIVSDFLGYFAEELSYSDRLTVVALPQEIRGELGMKSLQKVVGVYTAGKAVGGLYDLANIRDYTPGDNVKKIIWSAYAKTGKLVVREDLGETRAKILLLIDIRPHAWLIGETPNTLAHIQLRFAASLVNFLTRNGMEVDAIVCSGIMPKVVANLRGGEESLYRIFSLIDAGGGCNSQLNGFINAIGYIDKELSQYDIAILLTNPITLSLDEPTNLRGLVTSLERLFIAMPMFKYDNVMGRDDIAKLLNGVSETLGETLIGMEFSEEGFEIIYGGEKP